MLSVNGKQKAKYSYGILEKQFRGLFKKASATKGVTGESSFTMCERLDNVYLEWVSPSRRGARQLFLIDTLLLMVML
jgi:small subunit ribosomal protein S4